MSDRELLQFAAKAAGIVGTWERDTDYLTERWYFNIPYDNQNMMTGFEWNPLADDGDALRLAVKLGISIAFEQFVTAYRAGETANNDCAEATADDPYAATRRAIVRAAAAIGKAL